MQYVEIDGKQYPFKFGMREMWEFSNVSDIKPVDGELDYDQIQQKVSMDFDSFLKVFHLASKKGARLHEKEKGEEGLVLTPIELEDAIDDDPALFERLQQVWENSHTVKQLTEEAPKKKPKKG